ncbi:MAG: Ig-like domain repeat protein, partial [Isosphaerales bacterium]
IVVNGLLSATGTQFINPGNVANSLNQIYVGSGGELTASNSTFGVNQLYLANGSVLKPGDLAGNTFNSTIYASALDLPLLAGNQSFQDIDILAATLNSGQTVSLIPLGTVTTANQRYVFPGPFTVSSGATLNVEAGASVLIRDAQQLLVNGTLNITGARSVAIEDFDDGGESGGIMVNGTITISNTSFTRSGGTNGDDTTFLQVNSGAQVTMSATTFAWDQLVLDSGASTISISGNDFSGVGANGIIAAGDPSSHIPLDHNYWGTGVPAQIDAKILDHHDNANLPTVDYQPFVNASVTTANPAQVAFSPTDQTVNLSASVTTTLDAPIGEGTVTFTILNGAQVIGQPTVPAPVSNGSAAGVFTLPGNTPIGQYLIEASYSGTSLYLPSTDTSQVLTVSQPPPKQLVVHIEPSSTATAGQAFTVQPVIYEEDQYGNIETGDNSSIVTATLKSGVGPLQGVSVTVSSGVATFTTLGDHKAETVTLTFNSGALASAPTNPAVVSPGVATELVIDIPPKTSVTAGNPLTDPIVIDEVDQYGNIETGDNSKVVTASLSSGAGSLLGTTTVTVSGGVASFNYLEDDTAGMLSLKFTAPSLPPVISKPTTVAPAPATQTIVGRPPGGVVAGNAFTLKVNADDPYGNVDTSYTGPVTVGLGSGSSGTLSGTLTVTAENGVATFNDLVSYTSGPLSLSVTSGSLTPTTSNPIPVAAAAARGLAFSTPPANPLIAGLPFVLVVSAEDQFKNVDPSYSGSVTISVAGDPAFTTTVQVQNGIATFVGLTLPLSAQGAVIQANAIDLTAAVTNPLNVIPIPTITGESVVMSSKTNNKGKKVGKPMFEGFEIDFSTPMNPSTAGLSTNYQVDSMIITRSKKKTNTTYKPVTIAAKYSQVNGKYSVKLTVKSTKPFAEGGRITIVASPPNGVSSQAGAFLSSSSLSLKISAKAKTITRG